MPTKNTKEGFIERSNIIHKNKYDYSKVDYKNNTIKVIIGCKVHGMFLITPSAHTNAKQGCPQCSNILHPNIKKTTGEFIQKAKVIHGDKYDYSKVDYKNNKIKVIIGCKVHGNFTQVPGSHLQGIGCKGCGLNVTIKNGEEFLKEVRAIHGDTYDYSKVIYVHTGVKINIICKLHGEFQQMPYHHLYTRTGCPRCSNILHPNIKKTTNQFIEEVRVIHGDTYDYSNVVYEGHETPVNIICKLHGEFEQRPSCHKRGQGCPICKKITTNQFIEAARVIHGDTYDYSNVVYESCETPVNIICKLHGEFEQSAGNHKSGSGCPICARINIGYKQRMSTTDFIDKAVKIHGDKYDYSKVVMEGTKSDVCIICKVHGEFYQKAGYHIYMGHGCTSCIHKTEGIFNDYLKNNKGTLNYIEFIHKFKPEWADLRETHRTFYEYDFYIEFYNGLKIIVEIDGAQHYQQVSNWTTPLHNQIRDHIKERLAVNEKRSTNVIRLKQEDIMNDTNNWQKKFEKFVTQKKSNNDEIEIIQAY